MSLEKIMVADDDQNICELLRLYLEKEQYTLVIANDGNEALSLIHICFFGPRCILQRGLFHGSPLPELCRRLSSPGGIVALQTNRIFLIFTFFTNEFVSN